MLEKINRFNYLLSCMLSKKKTVLVFNKTFLLLEFPSSNDDNLKLKKKNFLMSLRKILFFWNPILN